MRYEMFEGKRPDEEKLLAYGFSGAEGAYAFETSILDGQFALTVTVSPLGVTTRAVDSLTGEPYSMYLLDDAVGSFVGAVRAEVERVLADVADKCFVPSSFSSEVEARVLEHVRARYGSELEFLWEKFPKDAVLRRRDNGKWYALFVSLARKRVGLEGEGDCDIIVLRAKQSDVASLPDGRRFLPAYHMNKKNWLTAVLDRDADVSLIFALLDESYDLAKR